MKRAFVVNATAPRGGAYMSYLAGCVLHRHFGYTLVDVRLKEAEPIFDYDVEMETVSVSEMERQITQRDILLSNPSLSSHMFGLRLPGRKLMYVQDFRTFSFLDCHFDHYVSVSTVVQQFLSLTYGLSSRVIPACLNVSEFPAAPAWNTRTPRSVLLYCKDKGAEHRAALEWTRHALQERVSPLKLKVHNKSGDFMPQAEFLKLLGSVRYLCNLSLAEGFGLVPLEAMAMGTCVFGLDGVAGRDFMQFGHNSMTVPTRELTRLPDILHQLVSKPGRAEQIAKQGKKDAARYDHSAFESAWRKEWQLFLDE